MNQIDHFDVMLSDGETPLLRTTDENTAIRFAGWGFPVAGVLDDQVLGFLVIENLPSWRVQAAILPLL